MNIICDTFGMIWPYFLNLMLTFWIYVSPPLPQHTITCSRSPLWSTYSEQGTLHPALSLSFLPFDSLPTLFTQPFFLSTMAPIQILQTSQCEMNPGPTYQSCKTIALCPSFIVSRTVESTSQSGKLNDKDNVEQGFCQGIGTAMPSFNLLLSCSSVS